MDHRWDSAPRPNEEYRWAENPGNPHSAWFWERNKQYHEALREQLKLPHIGNDAEEFSSKRHKLVMRAVITVMVIGWTLIIVGMSL